MSARPWYAWYTADYRSKTSHLTFVQDSAYRKLLDAYYDRGGPIDSDRGGLFRITGAMSPEEQAAVIKVSEEFFVFKDNKLHHQRADEELAKQGRIREQLSEAGKRGAAIAGRGRPKGSNRPSVRQYSQSQPQRSNTSAPDKLNGHISLDPDGAWSGLDAQRLAMWKKAFPAVTIETELSKAAAWIAANPKNKKSNYARFINNWLSRAQDRAPAAPKQEEKQFVI